MPDNEPPMLTRRQFLDKAWKTTAALAISPSLVPQKNRLRSAELWQDAPCLITSYEPFLERKTNTGDLVSSAIQTGPADIRLRQLPVDFDHPESAAEQIIPQLDTLLPNGGAILGLGETMDINPPQLVRIENRVSLDSQQNIVREQNPAFINALAKRLSEEGLSNRVQFQPNQAIAGPQSVCLRTYHDLLAHAEQSEKPFMPMFCHVRTQPDSAGVPPEMITIVNIVHEEAQKYWAANKDNGQKLITTETN